MTNISPQAQRLIQQYQDWYLSLQRKKTTPTIHVDEVASRVAAFYEKIRGVIDWREEHPLRRGAMERNLKKRRFPTSGLAVYYRGLRGRRNFGSAARRKDHHRLHGGIDDRTNSTQEQSFPRRKKYADLYRRPTSPF